MAETKDSKPVSVINLIRNLVEDNGSNDLDSEWSLFTRFGQSIYQFCSRTWTESEIRTFLDNAKECASNSSYSGIINTINGNDGIAKTISMLVEESKSSQEENKKSCNEARKIREEGTEYFKKKQYEKALESYSKAIVFAPNGSEEMSFCLANRSATFYYLGLFNDCLKDIALVLANSNYPVEKLYLVYARKVQCLKALSRDFEAQEVVRKAEIEIGEKISDEKMKEMMIQFLGSSFIKECKIVRNERDLEQDHSSRKVETSIRGGGFHESIPGASNKIEMKQNESKGRHVVASQEIPASTVLFNEESFAFWLRPSLYDRHCFNCLGSIYQHHFIPCPGCTFARYCSDRCLHESKVMFHKKECDRMSALSIMSLGHMALRTLHRMENDKKVGAERKNMVKSLIDHLNKFPSEMLVSLTLSSLFLANLFFNTQDQVANLAALILKYTLQINCNSIGIQYNDDQMYSLTEPNIKIIGMGLYPSIALMNHSCDKRSYTIFNGSKSLCIKSSIDFGAGEEITLCYGPFYRRMSTKDRQSYTEKNYFFKCDCSCCIEKKEPIGSAFSCPAPCGGAVIFSHSDSTSSCLKCDRQIKSEASQFFLSKLAEVKDQLVDDWNILMPEERWTELQKKLFYLLDKYCPFFYQSSEIIRELKEKLAVVFESMKMIEPAAKLWLECYKITKELEEGDDNYECLFYLSKITNALIEEADGRLTDKALVRAHVEKAMKYYKRCMIITKKLQGKEVKLLETSTDILHNIPNLVTIENDLKNLISYCSLVKS